MPSNLAIAIRTLVALVLAWGIVWWSGDGAALRTLPRASVAYLVLSGLATGLSWWCGFRALDGGPLGGVAALDKLSLPLTIIAASLLLGEHFGFKTLAGVLLVGGGTYLLIQK